MDWVGVSCRLANLFGCVELGALLFVSCVSVPTLLSAVDRNDTTYLRKHFPVWWPNGRNLMAPLGLGTIVSHLIAAYQCLNQPGSAQRSVSPFSSSTAHFIAAALIFLVLLWTKFKMMEGIDELRKADSSGLMKTARQFCADHHVRTLLALVAALVCVVSE
eukprot:TRINITY_DN5140_c0_g1_i1.p1 TRINITY_DN5140_c0_g1~~TRINITY_DN5140_c0_g1_i1.p1  ORF type:complete len:161 (-),score=17.13 TRINITY_DN5140_c0_g1_i1:50-532(-)